MATSTLARRSGAAVTGAAVAAALTLLTPVPAHAQVATQFAAQGSASADYTGASPTGTCDVTVPDADEVTSGIATFSRGTKHRSMDLDATFASSDNPADTVRVRAHSGADLTIKKKNRDLKAFDLAVGGSVKITHSMANSSCQGQGFAGAIFQIKFTEHHKGRLFLTRDTTKRHSISEFLLLNADNGKLVTLDLFSGDQSHATFRAKLKPGKYIVQFAVAGISTGTEGIVLKSGAPVSAKIARTVHLSGLFKRS
ncbi:MAG TPA: hypothetical protein VFM08_08315 [Nocardioides sp.]|jgi:hypothetical protein|nr:hypothetical protein [Nocardioides sp.]